MSSGQVGIEFDDGRSFEESLFQVVVERVENLSHEWIAGQNIMI
jgi:hypothetical protein